MGDTAGAASGAASGATSRAPAATAAASDLARENLGRERERVVEQLRQIGRAPGTERLEYDENFADSGLVTAERGEVDAIAGELLENVAEIDNALARVESGTYGTCDTCGGVIAPARLAAMPYATQCIACASARR